MLLCGIKWLWVCSSSTDDLAPQRIQLCTQEPVLGVVIVIIAIDVVFVIVDFVAGFEGGKNECCCFVGGSVKICC